MGGSQPVLPLGGSLLLRRSLNSPFCASSELPAGLYVVSFIPGECWNRIALENKRDDETENHFIKGVSKLACAPVRTELHPPLPGNSPDLDPRKEAPISLFIC